MSPLSNVITLTEKYSTGKHNNYWKPYLQDKEAVFLPITLLFPSSFIHE
jgi:hypothetical protein